MVFQNGRHSHSFQNRNELHGIVKVLFPMGITQIEPGDGSVVEEGHTHSTQAWGMQVLFHRSETIIQ